MNVFILSCGRYELLEKTLKSFLIHVAEANPIHTYRFFLSDDSGNSKLQEGISRVYENELKDYFHLSSFNEKNLGQVGNLFRLNSLASPHLIGDNVFLLEEDWEFVEDVDLDILGEFSFSDDVSQVVFRTDAYYQLGNISDFKSTSAHRFGLSFHDDEFIFSENNNHACFHPTIIKYEALNTITKDDETGVLNSAEGLIGERYSINCLFVRDKIYAIHLGDYRYYDVFPNARLRRGVVKKELPS
jgi:hypothetical protein